MVGVMGAAGGPLPLVWSVTRAYWIYLACAGITLGSGVYLPIGAERSTDDDSPRLRSR